MDGLSDRGSIPLRSIYSERDELMKFRDFRIKTMEKNAHCTFFFYLIEKGVEAYEKYFFDWLYGHREKYGSPPYAAKVWDGDCGDG